MFNILIDYLKQYKRVIFYNRLHTKYERGI